MSRAKSILRTTSPQPDGLRGGRGNLLERQAFLWSQICDVAAGLAIAPAIECLLRRGWLSPGGTAPEPARCAREGANIGFVAVALRALAQQGGMHCAGLGSERAADYRLVPELIAWAKRLMHRPGGGGPGDRDSPSGGLRSWLAEMRGERPDRARTGLLGFLAAPAVLNLKPVEPFEPAPLAVPDDALFEGAAGDLARSALLQLGWLDAEVGSPVLTVEGRMACAFAGQFRYPLSYLPLLEGMDSLLFGDPGSVLHRTAGDREAHLDRAADIRFSAEVFDRSCAPAFLATALPLFDRARGPARPSVVVDVGCGEARMLAALLEAVRADPSTSHSAADLLLVGVEDNPVAMAAARDTLSGLGAPFLVVEGDISRPEAIAGTLARHGIDFAGALHLNKSVIHDRALADCAGTAAADAWPDMEDGVFALPDGRLVDQAAAHRDLIGFFARWRPYLRRHGMIALEPHALDIATAASLSGSTMTATMEALHGFSCQYLTTADRFRDAAERGGLVVAARHMIGSSLTRHDHMSCTHLLAS